MPFFFFNDTATTEIYTLSLHDALPIWSLWSAEPRPALRRRPAPGRGRLPLGVSSHHPGRREAVPPALRRLERPGEVSRPRDRKSTRLNSSHANISYAVFCLKKKTSEPQ